MIQVHILLIEDETKAAAFICKGLSEHGYVVDVGANGEDGVSKARQGSYDLAVLDVMLPGLDGWEVLKRLRNDGLQLPVIFLTARDAAGDRVRGLELGADDYLVKPFAFAELLARIRTLLRRGAPPQADVFRIADLQIDARLHRATRVGRHLHLTPKEFQLLSCLARFPGEVVSRTFIAEAVWDIYFDTGTNMVEAAIRRLRAKLDDS